ncbi:MAG: prolyl oligopeptidase family serine peptidase, partial [Deltaproteobacteria bacterium]|nr:prolyl oligopeptidase family serine peptidase [Deltaproteobacteria bacterium]
MGTGERTTRPGRALFTALFAALALASPGVSLAQQASLMQRLEALEAHHEAGVPEGALTSIRYAIAQSGRMRGRYEAQSDAWRARAARYLTRAEAGADPFAEARGEITVRAYRSRISPALQNYGVYIPPNYDPSRAYPVYIALHGGSSNGNLFLGVVLGNNMDWLTYPEHLYDVYTPRWSPDWIVVAPTGFGQVMWRWMGEQDLLDVLADVERHYHVDADRVVLGGLSNGGVGAYAVGARHASRFSVVQAMSGAPSWLQYLGRTRPEVRRSVRPWSAMDLAENLTNTRFRYYHGLRDGGPMRPAYVRAFEVHLDELGMDNHATWYDTGHDILYYVHRHGRIYRQLAELRRDPRPRDVTLVSGDYRAAEQHWLRLTRIAHYPDLARVHGHVEAASLSLETRGARALRVDLNRCPLEGTDVRITVDGQEVYTGPRTALGQALHLVKRGDAWHLGYPEARAREKRPALSGPITDAYYDRMIHVFGTANAEHTHALERAARRGARGWPLWAWDLKQEVVADTDVTEEMMRSATVVLYGSPGDNTLLTRVDGALPIHVDARGVRVGERRFDGDDVGVRFIYPNPLAPERYVVVQAAVTPEMVGRANKLAEFGGDWVVFDTRTLRGAQRRVFGPNRPLDVGFFDDAWTLPETPTPGDGAGPDAGEPAVSSLPIPEAPPVPRAPREFLAPESDQ